MKVEILESAAGDKILKADGRLLASRFDPMREARNWLAQRGPFLSQVRTVFVLGLGSGYHIKALLERTSARILVLEACPEIARNAAQIFAFDEQRVRIEHVSETRSVRGIESVRAAAANSFVVLVHPASYTLKPSLYEECRTTLLARDWGNLTWQWRLQNAPDFERTARIDSRQTPLSIYDLEQTELVQNSEERERLLFKALRELVK